MKNVRFLFFAVIILFVSRQYIHAQTTYYANSVSGNDTNNGLSPAAAKKTFTAAYNAANSGDIIDLTGTFSWADTDEITQASEGFVITKSITIQGQGADQTFVQAQNSFDTNPNYPFNRRVFTFGNGSSSATPTSISIKDITIRYGYEAYGAFRTSFSQFTSGHYIEIKRCIIKQNFASQGGAGVVLISPRYSTVVMDQVIFDSNLSWNSNILWFTNSLGSEFIMSNSIFINNEVRNTNSLFRIALSTTPSDPSERHKLIFTNNTFIQNNNLWSGSTNPVSIMQVENNSDVFLKNNIFSGNTRQGNPLTNDDLDVRVTGTGNVTDNGGNIFDRIDGTQFATNNSSWFQFNGSGLLTGTFQQSGNSSTIGELFINNQINTNNSLNGMPSVAILNANSIAVGNAVLGSNDVIPQQNTDIRDAPRPSNNFTIGAYEYIPCFGFDSEAPALANGIYQISTFNHLRWISENSSSWGADFIQIADINALVTSDNCYNSGEGWSPIGNVSTKFTGTYNGNGHTISNLFINRPNNQRIALFGETNGASIERLGSVDPDITVTGTGQFGMGSNVGSLVGLADNGTTISECFASGGSVTAGGSGVGGLIGQLLWSSLNNSYAVVAVEGGDADINYSGGLVGVNSSSTISNCYAAGSVVFKQYNTGFGFFTLSRGLTQNNGGTITNSFYDSDATGQSTGGGTAKTTSQMQQQATFINWDFQCEAANGTADIWGMDEGNDYPRLSWQGIVQLCKSWIGSINTDWSNPNNWSPSGVPAQNENLIIDATAQNNLILNQDQSVGNITFNAAGVNITLNNRDLTFTGLISGADANNYVQTNDTGKLISNIPANSTVRFEVGRSAYNPVEIQPSVTDTFAVAVLDTVMYNNYLNAAIYVNRTWEITKTDTMAGGSVNSVCHWNANEIVNGPMNSPILNHYNGSNWENANGINTPGGGNPNLSLTHTNYTGAFSPFAISDASTPLPVEFLGMQYECLEQQSVSLTWQTASELNAQHFEVMRSKDGFTWEKVGTVAATGTTNQLSEYQFVDERPVHKTLRYYQLKQVDFDGNFECLPIISANCEEYDEIRLYPNPALNKTYITISSNREEPITMQLIDPTGRIVDILQRKLKQGVNVVEIDLTARQNGIYTILYCNNNKQQPLKLIINK